MLADLSAYYWVLTAVCLPLLGSGALGALAGFALFMTLKVVNAVRIPLASLALGRVGGRAMDVIDWGDYVVLVRVRVFGEGKVKLSVSGTTLAFTATLLMALARSFRVPASWGEALLVLAILAISTAFYRGNSTYIRALGVALSVSSSIVYAVSASLLIGLFVRGGNPLILSTLVNFLAVLLGCDILTIKWTSLTGSRSLIIGGMGIYDAVVLIPTASYMLSGLLLAIVPH